MRFLLLGPRLFGLRTGLIFGRKDWTRLTNAMKTHSAGVVTGGFVYVIHGKDTNRHKIGWSTDPIKRLGDLQTGSSEPLDFDYIVVTPGDGAPEIEHRAHDILDRYRMVGEWFAVPASIAIGAVVEAAGRINRPIQQVTPQMVPQILAIARREAAKEAAPGKYCGIFNPYPWYIRWSLSMLLGIICSLFIGFLMLIAVSLGN